MNPVSGGQTLQCHNNNNIKIARKTRTVANKYSYCWTNSPTLQQQQQHQMSNNKKELSQMKTAKQQQQQELSQLNTVSGGLMLQCQNNNIIKISTKTRTITNEYS